jgi:hypothetical protein
MATKRIILAFDVIGDELPTADQLANAVSEGLHDDWWTTETGDPWALETISNAAVAGTLVTHDEIRASVDLCD